MKKQKSNMGKLVAALALVALVSVVMAADAYAKPPNNAKNRCSDTDGGYFPSVRGTVSGRNSGQSYSYTDVCSTFWSVIENYCAGTSPARSNVTCGSGNATGTCVNGACV